MNIDLEAFVFPTSSISSTTTTVIARDHVSPTTTIPTPPETRRVHVSMSGSERTPLRRKPSRFRTLFQGFKTNTNESTVNEQRLKASKSALSLRSLFSAAQPTQRRRRESHSETPQSHVDDYLSIKPQIPGLFTPNLPPELWSLIFRYSVDAPFPTSPSHPLNILHCPSPEYSPVSFLTHAPPHVRLHERLSEYTRLLRWKASLTRVCRLWNALSQQFLYEFVWIAKAREGRVLAERLGGDAMVSQPLLGISSCATAVNQTPVNQKGKRALAISWVKSILGPVPSRTEAPQPTATIRSCRPSRGSISSQGNALADVGRHIRRLHIETPALDKCSPHDLLLILQHCPNLEVFSDYRSVRRPMHPLALSLSPVVPFSHSNNPWSSHTLAGQAHPARQSLLTPDALLHALLTRPLKKLSWTNYDYEGGVNFASGVKFYEKVVGPRLAGAGADMEFLEIGLSSGAVCGMGRREEVGGMWSVGGCEEEEDLSPSALMHEQEERWKRERMEEVMEKRLDALLSGYEDAESIPYVPAGTTNLQAGFLTHLEVTGATTRMSISPQTQTHTVEGFESTLVLPALRSLKVTLDNATFFVLSTWDMPLLTHLSVMSADFAYAGGGFRKFFESHGNKLFQLELGHSTGDIEEAWLTEAPGRWEGLAPSSLSSSSNAALELQPPPAQQTDPFSQIPLDTWCPNLKQFICSADAEWNWQTPDWIAPHVLLPAHRGVELIGVRDMERRLIGDAEEWARRMRSGEGGVGVGAAAAVDDEDPYFMLLEQFGSLLRPEAFPSLLAVRDMSWESDVVRRTGRLGVVGRRDAPLSLLRDEPSEDSTTTTTTSASASAASRARKLISKASIAHLSGRRSHESHSSSSSLAGRKVQRFWDSVAERCISRAVVLQDCRGEPVGGAF